MRRWTTCTECTKESRSGSSSAFRAASCIRPRMAKCAINRPKNSCRTSSGVLVKPEAEHLRTIYRSSHPDEKETFDLQKPDTWMNYLYQVRSNVTHRGKSAFTDFDLLRSSLGLLLPLFRLIKDAAFDKSEELARQLGALKWITEARLPGAP